jgi:hypothetical protein
MVPPVLDPLDRGGYSDPGEERVSGLSSVGRVASCVDAIGQGCRLPDSTFPHVAVVRLTAATDLALRILMRMAVLDDGECPPTRVIAAAVGAPPSHAAKVVTRLRHLGVLEAIAAAAAAWPSPRPDATARSATSSAPWRARGRRRVRRRSTVPTALGLPVARGAAGGARSLLRRARPVHDRRSRRGPHRARADQPVPAGARRLITDTTTRATPLHVNKPPALGKARRRLRAGHQH